MYIPKGYLASNIFQYALLEKLSSHSLKTNEGVSRHTWTGQVFMKQALCLLKNVFFITRTPIDSHK